MVQVGLLLLCISAVTVGAPPPPPPPSPPNIPCVQDMVAVGDFDKTKFSGKWYEVRKFASVPGREGSCEAVKYAVTSDGPLTVQLGWMNNKNEKKSQRGTIKPIGTKPTDAVLSVELENTPAQTYTIFSITYNKYFGVYACIAGKANVWVFAREKEVEDTALQGTIYSALGKYPTLKLDLFSKTVQKECQDVI